MTERSALFWLALLLAQLEPCRVARTSCSRSCSRNSCSLLTHYGFGDFGIEVKATSVWPQISVSTAGSVTRARAACQPLVLGFSQIIWPFTLKRKRRAGLFCPFGSCALPVVGSGRSHPSNVRAAGARRNN